MSITAHVSVGLLMLAASAVMLFPFTNLLEISSALHSGDGRVQAWVLAWVGHALGTWRPLFDANMFHPAPSALAHTEHMVALGALGSPIWWATRNAILEFNLLQLFGPALSAYAMFVLAYAWTRDPGASLVAGLGYGFSSFTLLHNAHLNLTWSCGLPLSVFALERWWGQPTWPRLACWWIPAVFTALVSWYLALLLALLMATWTLWLLATRERTGMTTRVVQLLASGALAGAVLLPLVAPYLGRASEAGEAAAFAADWRSYLVPSEHTVVGRWLVRRGVASAQGIWGERTLFLGWTFTLLAALGALTASAAPSFGPSVPPAPSIRANRHRVLVLVVLAAVAVALSLGPSPSGRAPFDLVAHLPVVSGFRATARFALLVTFSCALLAAMGVSWLRQRLPFARAALPALCACLLLFEVFVVDFPPGRPAAQAIPEIYRLAGQDGARAAVALPMYAGEAQWFLEGDYLLYSTTAGFVPLANGIGRWVPPEYLAMGEATRTFPSPETAAALRLYGVTHVLFHGERYGKDAAILLDRVGQGTDFSIVASRGSDTLLRVNATEARNHGGAK